MRKLRARLANAQPDAAIRAARRLPEPLLRSTRCVAGYRAIGGEFDPGPVLERFTAAGSVLALPFAATPDAVLTFRRWVEGDAFATDAYGVPSPALNNEVRPDVIIAPLLAFDRRGGRLGRGGGAYDRTLAALRAGPTVFVIGLGFAAQEVDAAPMQPHDERLDAVLTEECYLEFR